MKRFGLAILLALACGFFLAPGMPHLTLADAPPTTGWRCVPIFYPWGVAEVWVTGTNLVTFTTSTVNGVKKLEHRNADVGNLQVQKAVVWNRPSVGIHSSQWEVQDQSKSTLAVDVVTTMEDNQVSSEPMECYRYLLHLTLKTDAEKVRLQGENLDEVIVVNAGVAVRRWLAPGDYKATPIINGVERVDLQKQITLQDTDVQVAWPQQERPTLTPSSTQTPKPRPTVTPSTVPTQQPKATPSPTAITQPKASPVIIGGPTTNSYSLYIPQVYGGK